MILFTDPDGRPAAASVTASPCPIRAPPAPGCRITSRQSSRPGTFQNRCRSRWETIRRTTATGMLPSHPAKTTTSTFRRSAAWRRSVDDRRTHAVTESLSRVILSRTESQRFKPICPSAKSHSCCFRTF